jgi:hypothetical protein
MTAIRSKFDFIVQDMHPEGIGLLAAGDSRIRILWHGMKTTPFIL